MAFVHAVAAITEPGDEIVLNAPFYFNHEMAIQMAGCAAVAVETDRAHQPRIDALCAAITDRTRAIVTVSPNNPSGAVFSESALRAVNDLCRERGLYHIADEVYEYFTYGGARHVSAAAFPGAHAHTITMFSLSKAYGFAGWRVGYLTYPEHLDEAMAKSQDTILVCPTVAAQVGAIAALDVGRAYCRPHVEALAEVRDIVVSELGALAPLATVPAADGAFYVLLKVDTDASPMTIAERLVREHKVAVIPGPAFGMTSGCSFRVAYGALQRDTVAEGLERLVSGLRAIAG
jgi:aspartate/methionine/tyrosine aminotransferase